MPDAAIFADTGAEPAGIYKYLDYIEALLPFPVYRVMHKDGLLRNIEESANGVGRFAGAPFFTEADSGIGGQMRRYCTGDFKIDPIQQKLRALLGAAKGERIKGVRATQWIGISTDEAQRMKPARERWCVNRWPLIEANMNRRDCLAWMARQGYRTPTKSSCTFCPYHDDRLWRDMKMNDAPAFAEAVRVDEMIRNGLGGISQKMYLHRSRKPLAEVDFRSAEDVGQERLFDDAFGEECEGMCGV